MRRFIENIRKRIRIFSTFAAILGIQLMRMETNPILKALYHLIHILEEILTCLKRLLAYFDRGGNEQMTRQQVKEYLGIGESTYKRRVNDGTLKPMKMPGGHRYYKRDLEKMRSESVRRGRI